MRRILHSLMEPETAITKMIKELLGAGYKPSTILSEVGRAAGCILAETIQAAVPVPHFPRSIMDGYAVRYEDTLGADYSSPRRLRLVGRARIGEYWSRPIGPGEAVEVDTGAGIPPNATAVVPVEHAEERDGWILVYEEAGFGDNVAWPCSDASPGDIIAPRGTPVTPALAAALSAQGITKARIYRPKITIIPTGVELLEPTGKPETPPPGKVYESSSRAVEAMLQSCCVDIERAGIVPDDEEALRQALREALETSDMVLFIGGTSAGTEDIVYRVVADEGIIIAHGLKLKPGKPTILAIVAGKPVIGLPGNPASALNVTEKVVLKILAEAAMAPPRQAAGTVKAELLAPAFPARGRHTTRPVLLLEPGEGTAAPAIPLPCESYMITCFSRGDAEITIPAGLHGGLEPGAIVTAALLNPYWRNTRVIVAELLGRKTLNAIASSGARVKILEAGSQLAIEALQRRACSIAVIDSEDEVEPPPGYEVIETTRTLKLVTRSRNPATLPAYPPTSTLARIQSSLIHAKHYIPCSTTRAAAWLLANGYLDAALLPATDNTPEEAATATTLRQRLTIYYRREAREVAETIASTEAV
ncbi:MAG: hypothetical protein GXO09_01425 [Crenarchaeota archaeon]|nr:hypothetical protein [Thermoproteota archaeon]